MNCKFCKADCCSRGLNRDAAFCAGWIGRMTNADRIRAMTDEELAQFLCETHVFEGACSGCIANEYCKPGHNGMFEWLREEVKE